FIRSLQADGRKVLMIGDGLNDAGALRQSDVGISIAEDLNNFFPACDAILQAGQLDRLERFLHFARRGMTIIRINFIISLLYNLIGLSFAVQGTLSPLICAVLMPLSSISVILFSTGAAGLMAYRLGLNRTRRQSWEKTVLSVDDASEAT
ncbi:MAG: heavy metal translocating P-type ATPase, partial [Calditrichaeota bacterium]|nr:heavy metal translocating P-type ATPase [Calditrichota bacterium]